MYNQRSLIKLLFSFLFIVRVTIPMGFKGVYENVEKVEAAPSIDCYKLTLTDGRTVYAPIMFTVVEEK